MRCRRKIAAPCIASNSSRGAAISCLLANAAKENCVLFFQLFLLAVSVLFRDFSFPGFPVRGVVISPEPGTGDRIKFILFLYGRFGAYEIRPEPASQEGMKLHLSLVPGSGRMYAPNWPHRKGWRRNTGFSILSRILVRTFAKVGRIA